MDKQNTSALKEQFENECKVIELAREYPGYTGTEKYGIITSLSEGELKERFGDVLSEYSPYLILDNNFGSIRASFIRNEEKHRWRRRTGHIFPIDESFDEHHPECCVDTTLQKRELSEALDEALDRLSPEQKRRVSAYYFQGKKLQQIAETEKVSFQAVAYSIDAGLRNLKKFLEET